MTTTNKEKLKVALFNIVEKLKFTGWWWAISAGYDSQITEETATETIKKIKRDLA